MESPPPDYEPKMLPFHRFKIVVIDRLTNDRGEFVMESVRAGTPEQKMEAITA